MKRPVVLIILDGWGIAPPGPGNYISQAKTSNFDNLLKKYPHTKNEAAGNAVGLPTGAQGNSEVGHLHMGAGRIVWQMYERINRSIKDGSFYKNKTLLKAIKHVKTKGTLHLMGLCSDEGVHAHTDHLIALLKMAKKERLKKVVIHFFADGRDVAEKSALKYVKIIENARREIGTGRIVSLVGRYYSMDRDKNWERTKAAYDMLTGGRGFMARSASEAAKKAYKRGDKTDYYIQPTVIRKPVLIKSGDSVIFFNFRTDRPRQLTKAFIEKDFKKFKREHIPKILYTTMTEYDKRFKCPFAFSEEKVKNNLGQILAKAGMKQLRIAETEKYAHVTYFFNSQVEKPNKGEDKLMIPSPKVSSYDQKPEMSAYGIVEKLLEKISEKKYDFILTNFANCDLVGHSAVKNAIIKCVEIVDDCAGKTVEAGLDNGYTVIVTADHGSAEEKLYPDGTPKPAHSSNPVPFIVISNEPGQVKLKKGGQKDVAPTILEIMGLKKPKEMTGKSLIISEQ
ncbi:2,3-bisphosphoglycerate-independent phosphoglycerate mutase [bacterium]|nr:2,3-bisphosphoglycerate-independent phosphoglycerate mutase [bacterium]